MIFPSHTRNKKLPLLAATALLAVLCAPAEGFAACSTPAGNAGDIVFSSSSNTMAYCNGTFWIAMGSSSNVSYGTLTTNDFCVATSGTAISCSTVPTGTGNVVLSASPTLTGTVAGANSTWTGQVAIGTTTQSGALNVAGTITATGAAINGTATATTFSGSGASLTGIGTSNLSGITGTPSSSTYLRGDGTWATAASGTTTGTGAANYMAMWTGTSSLSSSAIYQSGSSIGIGTTGPADKLQVSAGNIRLDDAYSLQWGGTLARIVANSGVDDSMDLVTNNSSRIKILASGNVGIGTATPLTALHVNGTATATTFSGSGASLTGIGVTNLGGVTGTANNTTFLRGDGTWAAAGNGSVTSSTAGQVAYYAATGSTVIGTTTMNISNGQVGIGTATPVAALTVNGTAAFMLGTDYTTTGSQADVAINTASTIRYNGTAAATFYGIAAGTNGQIIHLHNASNYTLTLSNQSGSESTAANKIITGTGADLAVASNSSVIMQYDNTAARWRVIGGSGGATLSGGTANELPLWTSSTTIGTSNIYQSGSAIGIGTSAPNSTALLDVYSTTTGFLPPRMTTTQMNAISSPASGLTVYNTSNNVIDYYNGSSWNQMGSGGGASAGGGQLIGTYTSNTAVSNYSIVFNGAANSSPSLSGSTLTLPSNTSYIVVQEWGGGGGGGGSGGASTSGSDGSSGSSSCFGTNSTACTSPILTAGGGSGTGTGGNGGSGNNGQGGQGGAGSTTVSGGDVNIAGGAGAPGTPMTSSSGTRGGPGGNTAQGGTGGVGGNNLTGIVGNSPGGGGGGGGGTGSGGAGGGGGSGAFAQKLINSPTGTYYYTIGAGGSAGAAGANGGMAGGAGATGGITIYVYASGVTSGTVGTGATGNVAYYNAAGTAISPFTGMTLSGSNVGVGITAPATKLHVSLDGGVPANALYNNVNDGIITSMTGSTQNRLISAGTGNSSYYIMQAARGTLASPTALVSGDLTGALLWMGYDGTTRATSAGIASVIDSTVSSGVTPGAITFNTYPSGSAVERMRITSAGNVGIGTATAGAALTVNGTAAFMLGTDYTTTGAQSDVAINTASTIRYNGTAAATFYGIVAGTNGQIVHLHNASSFTLTLSNQSGSEATAANKIITGSGADLVMASNSSVILQYDTTASRWRVIGGSGGGALASLSDVTVSSPTSGNLLTYNGSKWVNSTVNSAVTAAVAPSFSVNKGGTDQTVTANTVTKLTWNTVGFDTNNNFSTGTGRYTPTIAGKYIINVSAYCSNGNGCAAYIYKNGVDINQSYNGPTPNTAITAVTAIVDMNGTSDYLEAYAYNQTSTTIQGGATNTYFSGGLLAPLASGSVAGTGTANYIPMWSNSTNLTNSAIAQSGSNVGIGTVSPTSANGFTPALQMSGSYPALVLTGSTGGKSWEIGNDSSGSLRFIQSNTTSALTATSAGLVGVGTSIPAYQLDVINNQASTTAIAVENTNAGGWSLFRAVTPGAGNFTFGGNASENRIESLSTVPMTFRTNSAERMRIDSSGYVSIGTTATDGSTLAVAGTGLHVTGTALAPTTGAGFEISGGTTPYIQAYNRTGGAYVPFRHIASYMTFEPNGTEMMRVNTTGVGIGTTAPVNNLVVSSTGTPIEEIHYDGAAAAGTKGKIVFTHNRSSDSTDEYLGYIQGIAENNQSNGGLRFVARTGSDVEVMRITSNGNLMINTTSQFAGSNARLLVGFNSTNEQGMVFYNTGGTANGAAIRFVDSGGAYSGGGIYYTSSNAVSYTTSSDRRLKDNITLATGGLDKLMLIGVVDFNFKSDPGKRMNGFIAQDLYKIYPDAVQVGTDDVKVKPWSVDYGRITPLLVKAIQELKALFDTDHDEIAKLKAANVAQEAEIKALTARIDKLEAAARH